RLLVRDARGPGVRNVLLGVRRERAGTRHLDRPRPPQGHSGRMTKEGSFPMRLGFGARRGIFAALAIAFVALLPGCSKKMTSVDPGYSTPDGTLSPASKLIVYPDRPNVRSYYLDLPPPGPDPGDPFDHAQVYRYGTSSTVHGVILDGTAANGYQ